MVLKLSEMIKKTAENVRLRSGKDLQKWHLQGVGYKNTFYRVQRSAKNALYYYPFLRSNYFRIELTWAITLI